MNFMNILRRMSVVAENRIKIPDVWRADLDAFLQLSDRNLRVADYMFIGKKL